MEIVACLLLLGLLGVFKFFLATPVGLAIVICLVIAAVVFFLTGSWIAGLIVAPLVFILILWLAGSNIERRK